MASRWKWIVVTTCLLAVSQVFATKPVVFRQSKITLTQGKIVKKITVQVAETPAQHEYGLMNVTNLPKNEGMMFVFNEEAPRSFWMKNTLIDLSIGFFDKSKKLIDIQEMKAMTSVLQTNLPSYTSQGPAQYALEMNAGWFKKNNIKEGAVFKF